MKYIPFIRGKIIWSYIIPQVILILTIFWAVSLYVKDGYEIYYGIIIYWIILILLRNLVAKAHRKGVALMKRNDFGQAIVYFQKSVDYFDENPWVDKYRYITLLSASRMTYREMGLCNIAFSLTQLGRGNEAKEIYSEIIEQYPENGTAIAALNMLQSV
jgi:tetratricopeptide (TPR) repeat protein